MQVSVIIPVKNDGRIAACVLSVLACAAETESLEVLVVDNGSDLEARRTLDGLPAGVRVLDEPAGGSYRARNRGIEAAGGGAVFFTDADCLVRPGWVREGLAGLAEADIAQGFSGSAGRSPTDRLIQSRYASHFRSARPGRPTWCDTRNLAVRRTVFDSLRFNDGARRSGDSEFGLLAERAGFRVAYQPGMRVDHFHEDSLAVYLAKKACHGWGAQRITSTHPGIRWHGSHLRLVARVSSLGRRLPKQRQVGRLLAGAAVLGGRVLDGAVARRLPASVAGLPLIALDKLAAIGGHLMYETGGVEPGLADFLRRPVPRD